MHRKQPAVFGVLAAMTPPGPTNPFVLTDDNAGPGIDTVQFALAAGAYTVQEINIPAGWSVSDITCNGGIATGDITTASASVTLAAGGNTHCTFTNTQSG